MKLVTWNINSIKVRGDFVALYLDAESPDVLCLQELKVVDDEVPRAIFEERGYHLAIHAQKTWNGVLIASKEPVEDVEAGLPDADEGQARLVSGVTSGIRFVNLYCPQGSSEDSPKFAYKLRFYDALLAWLGERLDPDAPFVLCGDMNVAPEPDDVWDVAQFQGVPSYHPQEHARWARVLALGLTDAVKPHLRPGTFSYWDYRRGAFHKHEGMRIDHHLVTRPVAARVSGARIERDWRKKKEGMTPSDHAPVVLELGD